VEKTRRKLLRNKRAIVGIEAAIVLIAFVVVASALAYIAINMGFFASQKSKDTISRGISEATSALELDGSVIAKTDSDGKIKYIAFPVKLSVGRSEVDLGANATVVSVYAPDDSFTLLDIYNGVNQSLNDPSNLDTIINSLSSQGAVFIIYNDDNDTVLERNEKAFLVINLGNNTIDEYHEFKVEVRTEKGATLTVERTVPGGLPASDYVDLG